VVNGLFCKDKKKPKLNPKEKQFVDKVLSDNEYVEQGVRQELKDEWHDEYLMYIGKQWDTKFAPRPKSYKKECYNSVDNFIFPTINNMRSMLTASMPEVIFEAFEPKDDFAVDKLNHIVPNILDKNKFQWHWRKIVNQFIQYGPAIGMVTWDNDWIGGSGPNRWIGEVRVQYVKKDEIFFDPAILDLEERLQECSYIIRRLRKKLSYFKDRWGAKGELVVEDQDYDDHDTYEDEGPDPQQATLIEYWHKGTPWFVSEEDKARFLEKAELAEAKGFPWKAQEYRDKAAGIYKGVHVAYVAGDVLLEYVPYVYEDGLYPFVFRVLYHDEEQPYGLGEIRNIKMPQVMYNLVDEIEIGAMAKQGLGGAYYNKGAISQGQLNDIRRNQHKGGQLLEVNDISGIKERQGIQVPPIIPQFKSEKKNIIDTVSQNTAILQGIAPGSRTPYSVVRELGARADQRNKEKINILSEFFKEMCQLIVNRVAEFYTEARLIRLVGDNEEANNKKIAFIMKQIAQLPLEQQQAAAVELLIPIIQDIEKEKTFRFSNADLKSVWERETGKFEEFIPEFDIKVIIRDSRPNDQDYITNIADRAVQMGILGPEEYWQAIREGKLPRTEDVLSELEYRKIDAKQPRGTPSKAVDV
jgi:hypothetical protein